MPNVPYPLLRCVKQIIKRLQYSRVVIYKRGMSKMPTKRVTSVADVIHALGGTGRAAEFFMVSSPAVSNMLARETIPYAYHLRVYLHLTNLNFEIDAEAVFGYSIETLGNGQVVKQAESRPAA